MDKHKAWNNNSVIAPISVGYERTDEADFQGEFNSVPGWKEQPVQCPQTYNCIKYSKLT